MKEASGLCDAECTSIQGHRWTDEVARSLRRLAAHDLAKAHQLRRLPHRRPGRHGDPHRYNGRHRRPDLPQRQRADRAESERNARSRPPPSTCRPSARSGSSPSTERWTRSRCTCRRCRFPARARATSCTSRRSTTASTRSTPIPAPSSGGSRCSARARRRATAAAARRSCRRSASRATPVIDRTRVA